MQVRASKCALYSRLVFAAGWTSPKALGPSRAPYTNLEYNAGWGVQVHIVFKIGVRDEMNTSRADDEEMNKPDEVDTNEQIESEQSGRITNERTIWIRAQRTNWM